MPFSPAATSPTRAGSADSLRDLYLSTLENCRGERTEAALAAYLQDQEKPMSPIGLKSLSPRALAVAFICWLLLILVLVFGFIQLTCAETLPRGGRLSLMDASPLGSGLGIWMGRRLYCSASRPCDAWSPTSTDGPFDLRLVVPEEEVRTWTC